MRRRLASERGGRGGRGRELRGGALREVHELPGQQREEGGAHGPAVGVRPTASRVPMACSGGMNAASTMRPLTVEAPSPSSRRAMPKSSTHTVPAV